jgi:N-acetylmuramoyl-L-alanine amidase
MQLLRRGDSGPAVVEIRAKLREYGLLAPPGPAPSENYFDDDVEHAVQAFQQRRGLITDGIVGHATYRALREASWKLGDRMLALLVSSPMSGDDVAQLQERLLELGYDPGRPGGVFDDMTENALRGFQRDYGLTPDGVCGPATLRSLRQLGRKVTGGRPGLLREQELLRRAGPRLRGKRCSPAARTPAPRTPSAPRSRTPPARISSSPCTPTRTTACTLRGSRPSTSATARARRPPWARRSPG